MQHYDIVIIDSGIDISKFSIDDRYTISCIGKVSNIHGSQIYSIMRENIQTGFTCLSLNVYDSNDYDLLSALEYIQKNVKWNIINISAGLDACDAEYRERLQILCKNLVDNGATIVAAFSNQGTITYPAAFKEVIGVDISLMCRKINEFEVDINSIANLRGTCQKIVVKVGDESYSVAGTSFVTPFVSALIFNLKLYGKKKSEILRTLGLFAKRVKKGKCYNCNNKVLFDIKRVVLFPFNKEIENLIRNNDLMQAEIEGIYDYKGLGNIGKTVNNIAAKNIVNAFIQNYETINWQGNFDTIILGHLFELNNIVKMDFLDYFIKRACEFNKNIVALDILDKKTINTCVKKSGIKIYSGSQMPKLCLGNRYGKLHLLSIPVVGIFGTRSRQGKFTLQLKLYRELSEKGYEVGLLGTEPTSQLLGFDAIFPCGYGASMEQNHMELIPTLNELFFQIEEKKKDIILFSSQSHTIPQSYGNMGMYPIYQQILLYAGLPDKIILTVHYDDDIEYVKRTIEYLEKLIDTNVMAIVIFPYEVKYTLRGKSVNRISDISISAFCSQLQEITSVPIYKADDNFNALTNQIIEEFSE